MVGGLMAYPERTLIYGLNPAPLLREKPNSTFWLIETVEAYRKYDPAAKSSIEILLFYPGVKALLSHAISHFFYRHGFFLIARLISEVARWLTLIEIHPGAKIGRRVIIDHGAGIVIGETAEVGDDCIIFHGVTLGGTRFNPVKRHPTLGNRVLVGAGAKILGPIVLGDGVKVGANAVVTKSAQAGESLVGIPAKPKGGHL